MQSSLKEMAPQEPGGGTAALCVERLQPAEFGTAARILASAFADDPVFLWAMPKAASRLVDATAFFTFLLRRGKGECTKVFATSDRSAVAVLTDVAAKRREEVHAGSPLASGGSPAAYYLRWIEGFSPCGEHRYLEFIGLDPAFSSRGRGSFLLGTLVETAARQGVPVWCWSSNPRNLSFYRRLGFEAGEELRRDGETPAVIPLLHLPHRERQAMVQEEKREP